DRGTAIATLENKEYCKFQHNSENTVDGECEQNTITVLTANANGTENHRNTCVVVGKA
ncbi:hypothetical protein A2U01_0066908, partial [Trifolium medium]|nr:hypothetical protein [Trifolium medium]